MKVEVSYLFLIPLLPAIGAVYNGCFGRKLHRRFGEGVAHWPAVLLPWGGFVTALVGFIQLAGLEEGQYLYQNLWAWMPVGVVDADLAFMMDRLSGVMALVVTFVGSLIHIYSTGYMKGDGSYWRFFFELNLFMFAMLCLVLGDNFLLMFVGWEGVGLCSYLLISFWFTDRANAAAGMKAFVVNRVGDFGFAVGLYLLFWGVLDVAGETSLRFSELERVLTDPAVVTAMMQKQVWGVSLPTLAGVLLFVGATAKSAQIPLYVWLPDAMAGPTPVSALIHAATMVTAGVYMVARLHFVFTLSPMAMTIVALVGGLTALFAASIGLFQYDIKKVLAYSTVSQLGFMFMAVGVGAYWVGIFHLMTHAFFKACLFLGSGSVILGCHHEQDMRKMGGLAKLMPRTHWTYFVSCLAIAGFPIFAGFCSKDEILWKAFNAGTILVPGWLIWGLGAIAALGTSFYMFRSYYMTFSGEYRGGHAAHGDAHDDAHDDHGHHGGVPHESPLSMTAVLMILGALAVVGGLIGFPQALAHLIHVHIPNLFEHWLEPVFGSTAERVTDAGFGFGIEMLLMALSVISAFAGLFLARWLYKDGVNPIPQRLLTDGSPTIKWFHRLIYNKYFVDEAYHATAIKGSLGLAERLSRFDQQVVDGAVNLAGAIGRLCGAINGAIDRIFVDGAVNLVASIILKGGAEFRQAQTGRIQSYLLGLLGGGMVLLLVIYLAG